MTNVMTGRARESGPRNRRGIVRPDDLGWQAAPRSPVIGHWLLVIHWSLVIGDWSFTGHWSCTILCQRPCRLRPGAPNAASLFMAACYSALRPGRTGV